MSYFHYSHTILFANSRICTVLIALIYQCSLANANRNSARFIPLGDLPGGTFQSFATGISDDGLTIVGSSNAAERTEAFIWTEELGLVSIGGVGTNGFTAAGSASADGSVVVGLTGESGPSHKVPFYYTAELGFQLLSGCGCNGPSYAVSVSGDGKTIVGSKPEPGLGVFGYRWTEEIGPVSIGDLPGGNASSLALDVSSDGGTIVGVSDGNRAFRWAEDIGMVAIDLPMASASGVSQDGSAIAGTGFLDGQGVVRWTESEGSVWLGHLPGLERPGSFAADISADGSVIVGGSGNDFRFQAFRWTEAAGMQPIQGILENLGVDMTGWALRSASSVSADGSVIVGTGTNPDGNTEGWVAYISPNYVPEPSSAAYLISGVLSLLYYPQRRHRTDEPGRVNPSLDSKLRRTCDSRPEACSPLWLL